MKKLMGAVSFGLLMLATSLPTEAQSNIRQKAQNKAQIEQTQKWLERDWQELSQFRELVEKLQATGETGDESEFKSLREQLLSSMEREIGQTKKKVAQAQQELKQSSREVRSEGRDVRRSREAMKDDEDGAVRDRVRNSRQRRDDRKDKADDRNDLQSLGKRAQLQQDLRARFSEIKVLGASDRSAPLSRQAEVTDEFIATLVADIAAMKVELGEDYKEAAEDKRESRTDRRERRRRR